MNRLQITLTTVLFSAPAFSLIKVHLVKSVTVLCKVKVALVHLKFLRLLIYKYHAWIITILMHVNSCSSQNSDMLKVKINNWVQACIVGEKLDVFGACNLLFITQIFEKDKNWNWIYIRFSDRKLQNLFKDLYVWYRQKLFNMVQMKFVQRVIQQKLIVCNITLSNLAALYVWVVFDRYSTNIQKAIILCDNVMHLLCDFFT